MPKRKISRKPAKSSRNRIKRSFKSPNFGLRGEQLPGDGTTWSLEMAMPKSRIAPESQVYKMVQTYSTQAFITTATTNPVYTGVIVAFNQIDQYAALASIWDAYRIDSCEVWLIPEVSDSVSSRSGLAYSVIDLDDQTALPSLGQAQDYTTCVTAPQSNGIYRHFIPRIAVAAYSGSAFNAFTQMSPQWIDSASSAVPHYGLKYAFSPSVTTAQVYDLVIKLHISLKNVR